MSPVVCTGEPLDLANSLPKCPPILLLKIGGMIVKAESRRIKTTKKQMLETCLLLQSLGPCAVKGTP